MPSPRKSTSRLVIVQLLYLFYTHQLEDMPDKDAIEMQIDSVVNLHKNDKEFQDFSKEIKINLIRNVTTTTLENIETIDSSILESLKYKESWKKIHILLKSIIRAAIGESICSDTGKEIVIDEYVGITSSFFSSKEIGFVNATLDIILSNISK